VNVLRRAFTFLRAFLNIITWHQLRLPGSEAASGGGVQLRIMSVAFTARRLPLLSLLLSLIACLLIASACTSTPAQVDPNPPGLTGMPAAAPAASSPTVTSAPSPATHVPSPNASTATLLPSPTPGANVCSPLAGFALAELPEVISNPYHPPKPGSDDPHSGVDLADRDPQTQVAIPGRAVQASLAGRVAAVVVDRFPFGTLGEQIVTLGNLSCNVLVAGFARRSGLGSRFFHAASPVLCVV
jgi:hypothetical protein